MAGTLLSQSYYYTILIGCQQYFYSYVHCSLKLMHSQTVGLVPISFSILINIQIFTFAKCWRAVCCRVLKRVCMFFWIFVRVHRFEGNSFCLYIFVYIVCLNRTIISRIDRTQFPRVDLLTMAQWCMVMIRWWWLTGMVLNEGSPDRMIHAECSVLFVYCIQPRKHQTIKWV